MALSQDPKQADYWLISARAAFGLGNEQEALENLETALMLAPDRTDLQLYKMIGMYQAEHYEISLRAAQEFLKVHPQEPLALLILALNEWHLGYNTRALTHLEQAAQHAEDKSFVHRVATQLYQEWK